MTSKNKVQNSSLQFRSTKNPVCLTTALPEAAGTRGSCRGGAGWAIEQSCCLCGLRGQGDQSILPVKPPSEVLSRKACKAHALEMQDMGISFGKSIKASGQAV